MKYTTKLTLLICAIAVLIIYGLIEINNRYVAADKKINSLSDTDYIYTPVDTNGYWGKDSLDTSVDINPKD